MVLLRDMSYKIRVATLSEGLFHAACAISAIAVMYITNEEPVSNSAATEMAHIRKRKITRRTTEANFNNG